MTDFYDEDCFCDCYCGCPATGLSRGERCLVCDEACGPSPTDMIAMAEQDCAAAKESLENAVENLRQLKRV